MTMWMPVALWALHRTMARGRLRDGLVTGIAFSTDSRPLAQAAKEFLGHNPVPTRTGSCRAKEGRVPASWHGQHPNPSARVVCKCTSQFWPCRNPPTFEEFRVTYGDQPIGQVDIIQSEREGFIEPHSCSVKKQQQRAISQCPQGRFGRIQDLGRRQQALEFIGRINVRHPHRWEFRHGGRQGRVRGMTTAHCVAIEATQDRCLLLPRPRNGSRSGKEGEHYSGLHILDVNISHAPAERAQQASFRLQTGAQGTLELNISLDDLV